MGSEGWGDWLCSREVLSSNHQNPHKNSQDSKDLQCQCSLIEVGAGAGTGTGESLEEYGQLAWHLQG